MSKYEYCQVYCVGETGEGGWVATSDLGHTIIASDKNLINLFNKIGELGYEMSGTVQPDPRTLPVHWQLLTYFYFKRTKTEAELA